MTTPTNSARRSIASLELPKTVPALITYATGIVKGMTGNPSFPSPMPTVAALAAAVALVPFQSSSSIRASSVMSSSTTRSTPLRANLLAAAAARRSPRADAHAA